jgi:hypothetical protein
MLVFDLAIVYKVQSLLRSINTFFERFKTMFFFKYRFLILFMMINVIHGKTPGHSDYRDFDGRPLLELIPTLSNHNVGDIESQISSLTPDHDQISSKVKEQQTKGKIEIRGRAGASILDEMDPQYGGPFVYPVELEMDRVIAKQQTRMGFKNLFSFFDKTKKDFLHDVTGIFGGNCKIILKKRF